FTESDDTTGTQKTIVNEAAVQRLMPGENAIGRHLLQGRAPHSIEYEIVGVASNVKQSGLDVPPQPEMYTSYADSRADWAGGDKARVVRLVLQQGLVLVAGGVVVGLIGAFLLSRMLSGMLYGVGTHDPLTFAAVSVILGTIAMLATAFPAWRAARVDPVIAL